jgi:hypothetical protein
VLSIPATFSSTLAALLDEYVGINALVDVLLDTRLSANWYQILLTLM